MRIAFILAALPLTGCLQGAAPAPAPSAPSQGPCTSFTSILGVVGIARYSAELDWAELHRELENAGWDLHPEPTAVAGREPAGRRFAMTGSGSYEVYYPWNVSMPWPSQEAAQRANASWVQAELEFNASVRRFEDATGLGDPERSWRPDLQSGTATCG